MNFQPTSFRFSRFFQVVLRYFLLKQVPRVHDRTILKTQRGNGIRMDFTTIQKARQ